MRSEPPDPPGAAGIYLHFPFCSVRCSYCDFPTVHGRDERMDDYVSALELEIARGQSGLPAEIDGVYFGGGTPSRMSAAQVSRLLAALRARFDLRPDAEITLEGNPESLDRDRLAEYREAGVTRISVGVQSLDDGVLGAVGRAHDGDGALAAIRRGREAGFGEINVDLIAGLPGEDLSRWGETVRRVANLDPDHVSVYLLETDKNSPLARSIRDGRTPAPPEDRVAAAYDLTIAVLDEAGLQHYEISNFAKRGKRSRHNMKYWTDHPYGGFGVGAHAYHDGMRRANRGDLEEYLEIVTAGGDPLDWEDPWDPERRLAEALVLGLRLVEGVDLDELGERYGADLRRLHHRAWQRAAESGMVEWCASRVRLTPWGRLRSNELFSELI